MIILLRDLHYFTYVINWTFNHAYLRNPLICRSGRLCISCYGSPLNQSNNLPACPQWIHLICMRANVFYQLPFMHPHLCSQVTFTLTSSINLHAWPLLNRSAPPHVINWPTWIPIYVSHWNASIPTYLINWPISIIKWPAYVINDLHRN